MINIDQPYIAIYMPIIFLFIIQFVSDNSQPKKIRFNQVLANYTPIGRNRRLFQMKD